MSFLLSVSISNTIFVVYLFIIAYFSEFDLQLHKVESDTWLRLLYCNFSSYQKCLSLEKKSGVQFFQFCYKTMWLYQQKNCPFCFMPYIVFDKRCFIRYCYYSYYYD